MHRDVVLQRIERGSLEVAVANRSGRTALGDQRVDGIPTHETPSSPAVATFDRFEEERLIRSAGELLEESDGSLTVGLERHRHRNDTMTGGEVDELRSGRPHGGGRVPR